MADLPEVHAINEAAVPAVGSESVGDLAHIGDESVIALVAVNEVTGEVGGFCMVLVPGADYDSGNYAWFSERYDDFVYLDRVAIAPAYQRQGVGRALYAEVERLAAVRRPTATDFTLEVNLRRATTGRSRSTPTSGSSRSDNAKPSTARSSASWPSHCRSARYRARLIDVDRLGRPREAGGQDRKP